MAETVRRISVMLRNCQCLHWNEMMTSRASSSSLLTQTCTSLVWEHLSVLQNHWSQSGIILCLIVIYWL